MRVFGNAEYTFTVIDRQSGDADGKPAKLTLFYRLPTTSERQEYINNLVQKDRAAKSLDILYLNRVNAAANLVQGVGEGCFGRQLSDGSVVPISSEKGNEYYADNWKEELANGAADLLDKLGKIVFDTPFSDGDAEKN